MEQAMQLPLATHETKNTSWPPAAVSAAESGDPMVRSVEMPEFPGASLPDQTEIDDFLSGRNFSAWAVEHASHSLKAALAEAEELIRQCRWQDLITLFHPFEEKMPELAAAGMDLDLRQKISFALGQLGRFEEALASLNIVFSRLPDNFFVHAAIAYTLVQSLRAAKGKVIVLTRVERDRRVKTAHQHFAMGKCLHALGRYHDALAHLEIASAKAGGQPDDFVWELAARCALALGNHDRAMSCIQRVPSKKRRPYVSWTESDVLIAQGRRREAIQVLEGAANRDRRARHKALIRLSRIHLGDGCFDKALSLAVEARDFCAGVYGNPSREAIFWEAAALYKLGRLPEALALIEELQRLRFDYPYLGRLEARIRGAL